MHKMFPAGNQTIILCSHGEEKLALYEIMHRLEFRWSSICLFIAKVFLTQFRVGAIVKTTNN